MPGEFHRIDPTHLSRADSHGLAGTRIDDRVRLDMLAHLPGKRAGRIFLFCWLPHCRDLQSLDVLYFAQIAILDYQTADQFFKIVPSAGGFAQRTPRPATEDPSFA